MKKRIIIALLTVMILVTGGVLIWDYNNPVAEIDIMQSGDYQTPLFVTLTQNRFIKNETKDCNLVLIILEICCIIVK